MTNTALTSTAALALLLIATACSSDPVVETDAGDSSVVPDGARPDGGGTDATPCDGGTSHATFMCDGPDVYWFDSCGVREEVKEACEDAGCTGDACAAPPEGPLTLHGFEVRGANPDRIYFSSNVAFTGLATTGFAIPNDLTSNTPSGNAHYDNAITGVTVNRGATADHYFTLGHAYVYGDNVLIKYDGGADFVHAGGAALAPFTHQRVDNQIPEPSYDGDVYYVDQATGDDDDTGLTEDLAFETIAHAARIAEAGDTVHIKAGDYGAERVVFANSGTAEARILFEGYQTTPGDSPDLGWSYDVQGLDASVMPLLDGGNRDAGFALNLFENENDYITLRNLQVTNYLEAVRGRDNHYLVVENVVAVNMGLNAYSGHGFTFIGVSYNNTFRDCVVENATATAYRVYGYFNAIIDSEAYCDEFNGDAGGAQEPTDYYTTFRGDWNYLAGVHLERVGDLQHGGHGITLKGDQDLGRAIGSVANNLAENSTVVHINGSVELRHRQVRFNTIRNIHIRANLDHALGRTGGFDIQNGASDNIVEDSWVEGVKDGISFFDGPEDQGAQFIARDNIVRNTVFSNNSQFAIRMDSYNAATDDMTGNQILHCTFVDSPVLFAGRPQGDTSGNVFIGNIVSGVASLGGGAVVFEQSYNNYFDGIAAPPGTGNISVDPLFVDASANDFHLQAASMCVDAGTDLDEVTHDHDGTARPQGAGFDLGAYERE